MLPPLPQRSPSVLALDDPAAITRIGVIALATDLTSERDFARGLPLERAALHVARVAFANPTTLDNLRAMGPKLTECTALLPPDVPLAAVCYSCTSASVTLGDREVAAAIRAARPGMPVVTPSAAARAAFGALGVTRIAMLTPYLPETSGPMEVYFTDHGFSVVNHQCLGMADDQEMARVSPATIMDAALAVDRPEAEALFLSCTALPALDVIAALEDRLGKPVVSSNQASLWALLGLAGLEPRVGPPAPAGFGQLLSRPVPLSVFL
ncbi:Asp/Glu racemase [Rhodospirillum sp. A1_3_36]|uniref:maleate cis-trans isomerase family protein n=1 Tax=Rhodospirillum sp. A1_3_36 TaxID=3391666 RepID=UPI0039A5FF8B